MNQTNISIKHFLSKKTATHLAVIAAVTDLMFFKAAFLQTGELAGCDVTLSANYQGKMKLMTDNKYVIK